MVDLDAFEAPTPSAVPVPAAALPDESPVESSFDIPDDDQLYAEPVALEAEEPAQEFSEAVSSFEAPDEPELPEIEAELPPPPAPAAEEPPRAMFAELGFDGPANDQIGWAATPSASHSEPEAAPEDWFDEAPSSPELEEVESRAEEPAQAEMSEPQPATDSWFEEVEGASMIEATEVASDEFWLPPDLHRVASTEASAEPESEPAEDAAPSYAAEAEAEAEAESEVEADADAVEAIAEAPQPEKLEYDRFDVEVAAEAAEDAVVVEHPFDIAPTSYWLDTQPAASEEESAEPAEPVAEAERAPVAESESLAPSAESESEPVAAASSYEPDDETERVEPLAGMPDDETERVEPLAGMMDFAAPSMSETLAPPAAVGHTSSYEEAEPPAPATPFVTETLAELYLQQGFRDEALAIYRQLSERSPGDDNLRRRIATIEQGEAPADAQPTPASIENRSASQSVRSFFSRLARRPAVTPPSALPDTSKSTPDVPFAAAASALANLFAASKPPATDEGAASTLAGAFTDPAGRPTRAADRELSLDHLFRDVPPGGQASGGVSLDEFYANPNAQPGSPTEPGEAGESPESGGTDIRQFTAWLEGLRKK